MKLKRRIIFSLLMTLVFSMTQASLANTLTEQGQDDQAFKQEIDKATKEQLVPGSLVYIQSPTRNELITYGTDNVAVKQSVPRIDAYFRIGSNTKSMISAVIVQMAQENLLNLQDPVSKYIKGVPNGDNITLALLMQNRSGLFNYLADPEISKQFDKNQLKRWTPNELLQLAFKHPNLSAPDQKFYYCNTNFILLGLIAEQLDKKPLYKIFENRLFKPLNMKHTYLPHGRDFYMQAPYAHGYGYSKSEHVFISKPYSQQELLEIKQGKLKLNDYTVQNASWAWAAGGVVSTPQDMAVWVKALSEGKFFNNKFYKIWLDSFVSMDARNSYGFGMMIVKRDTNEANNIFYHNGQLPGFNSYMVYAPAKKMTIIVWTNLGTGISTDLPASKLIDVIMKFVF